ncbi:MAG TPA: ATP-binding cassette domain-containing protein [Thermoanaerobaculia bacterium]|jgi:ABC-type glutathione transport system ATPase component/ABC-type dipeptide/oligopeptide/nickel transport system permease subunit|nr:ATP-binding cassette domain-containing protein [Thermoanaerobaculia bacterium]
MNGASGLQRLGVGIVAAMLTVALFGPLVAPYAPGDWVGAPFAAPSRAHWLGTDDMGQDLWSAWLFGARHSVLVALLVALGATAAGTLLGASAGYLGGWWDFVAMRLVDFQLTLPTLPLVLVVAFYVGPSRAMLVAVLIVSSWACCARELRPAAAALRHADSVVAQRAMGAGETRIITRHVIPAMSPLVLAQLARIAHHAVLLEASVSFLGLGDPAWSSWGGTLYYANARGAFLGDAWLWWMLPPGLGIALLVTGFALLGVGEPRGAALRAAVVPAAPPPQPGPRQLFEVRDLHVGYANAAVLRGLDLTAADGEVFGLLGASGAGKSTLAHALLGLLPRGGIQDARIDGGAAWLAGRDLLRDGKRGHAHAAELAWVPQAAMQSLNLVRRIGSQLREVAKLGGTVAAEVDARVASALEQVGLGDGATRAYPHQLSGGMRQRAVIAMVLCRQPRLLLADEPTSGLDAERAEEVLSLLVRLCRQRRMVLVLISHDLALLERHCDRLAVLDEGRIVESGTPAALLAAPLSEAGQAMAAAARPRPRFASRRAEAAEPVLDLTSVDFAYPTGAGLHDVSLRVHAGESVGLVGPSGAGKTTLAHLALGLLQPARGGVTLLGRGLATMPRAELRRHRRLAHLILQDPFSALPYHQTVRTIVAEPLRLAGVPRYRYATAVETALSEAGLQPPRDYLDRRVDSLSGGQRQRVALARALIAQPRLILADEPTSMLDAPAKWAWLERLDALRKDHGLAVLLITHDLRQANAFCDRIVAMRDGRLAPVPPAGTAPAESAWVSASP